MKTEEYKSIEDLLDRFFEGQTSNEEERVLYEFFARPDIPAHLERYREVFGYFESGIALDFSETPELRLPAKEISYKRKIGRAIAVCVAASLLLFLVNTVFMNQNASFNPYEGSYIVRNGVVMTDIKKIQPELEVISRAAEAMEKNADRLLRNADEIAYLPERMNKRFEKKRETLLRNIPDTQVRKEVYKILELDK